MRNFSALLIALLLSAVPTLGTTVLAVSFEELATGSQLIFQGEVIRVQSTVDADGTGIHTYVTFQIHDLIKGDYAQGQIVLRFLGGTVGDFVFDIADSNLPEIGDDGVYFVESLNRFQVNPFYGMNQGHFLILESSGPSVMMTSGRRKLSGFIPTMAQDKRGLSTGIALGLSVAEDGISPTGVTLVEFKEQIRGYLQIQ